MRVCATNPRWISTKKEGWLNFLVKFSLGVRKMTGKVELWLAWLLHSNKVLSLNLPSFYVDFVCSA